MAPGGVLTSHSPCCQDTQDSGLEARGEPIPIREEPLRSAAVASFNLRPALPPPGRCGAFQDCQRGGRPGQQTQSHPPNRSINPRMRGPAWRGNLPGTKARSQKPEAPTPIAHHLHYELVRSQGQDREQHPRPCRMQLPRQGAGVQPESLNSQQTPAAAGLMPQCILDVENADRGPATRASVSPGRLRYSKCHPILAAPASASGDP